MQSLTAGQGEVNVEGATVGEALSALENLHPGFSERLLDDEGELRCFVLIFCDETDIRTLDLLDTVVAAPSVLSIVPAVAGG